MPVRPAPPAYSGNTSRLLFRARLQLGLALTDAGQPEDALPHLEEAVRLAEAASARRALGRALVAHGTALRQLGRLAEATAVLERAVETVRDL